MIDFGNSKILESKDKTFTRTNTIIGTPHYMAPEMISSKGYTLNVDLWAVGVILYELMCGEVPFGENFDDPYKIYQDIIKKPVQYPNFLKDKKAKKLMEQLLNKVADARLGGSYGNLKANPWFEDFDFVS